MIRADAKDGMPATPDRTVFIVRLGMDLTTTMVFAFVAFTAYFKDFGVMLLLTGLAGVIVGCCDAWRTASFYTTEHKLLRRVQYHAQRANQAEAEIGRLNRLLHDRAA